MLIGISDQMGTRFDRLRCEVFQNLILSPMNTGLLRPAVATVLTVYGIETASLRRTASIFSSLQQSLPFTVLKLNFNVISLRSNSNRCNSPYRLRYWNGLETVQAYMSMSVLQQSLPFTVLKHFIATLHAVGKFNALQQSLPFTVLKLARIARCS